MQRGLEARRWKRRQARGGALTTALHCDAVFQPSHNNKFERQSWLRRMRQVRPQTCLSCLLQGRAGRRTGQLRKRGARLGQ